MGINIGPSAYTCTYRYTLSYTCLSRINQVIGKVLKNNFTNTKSAKKENLKKKKNERKYEKKKRRLAEQKTIVLNASRNQIKTDA